MKVRLLKDKTINGKQWKAGWVTGVDEATAGQWIAAGDAESVPDDARTFKYTPEVKAIDMCIPADEAPEITPAKPTKKVNVNN